LAKSYLNLYSPIHKAVSVTVVQHVVTERYTQTADNTKQGSELVLNKDLKPQQGVTDM